MVNVTITDEKKIKITLTIEDAISMVQAAAREVENYAYEIMMIYEKMPEFHFTHYCFYAYENSAQLFEKMLGIDPKQYKLFSLDAPDAFFYSLYGGMASLYESAKKFVSAA
ncbi:hypothetical protein [Bacillus sp. FJAT-50079]|uniref:hypothetical protein n=1 Tax=Bacillus sp. FJAT-50079 TaxID=2833577 RepID=UPI001BC91B70|nr:hypothetical protein [Bacillus sp. FJAT-50079]MBS4209407.1 hypothetical protein [Bacillus sp. FJAT-50079]